jgi:hypothetical protein
MSRAKVTRTDLKEETVVVVVAAVTVVVVVIIVVVVLAESLHCKPEGRVFNTK